MVVLSYFSLESHSELNLAMIQPNSFRYSRPVFGNSVTNLSQTKNQNRGSIACPISIPVAPKPQALDTRKGEIQLQNEYFSEETLSTLKSWKHLLFLSLNLP